MMTLKNNKHNQTLVNILKEVKETQWLERNKFFSIDDALRSAMFNSSNSGWYNPMPMKIKGLSGYFLSNEDGSLLYDTRIIKEENDLFIVEELSMQAFNELEKKYSERI